MNLIQQRGEHDKDGERARDQLLCQEHNAAESYFFLIHGWACQSEKS
jgi:hypothetical protein